MGIHDKVENRGTYKSFIDINGSLYITNVFTSIINRRDIGTGTHHRSATEVRTSELNDTSHPVIVYTMFIYELLTNT